MKITTVTYRRVVNLGNYQNETLEATAEVEKREDAHKAVEKLRAFVYEELGLSGPKAGSDALPF